MFSAPIALMKIGTSEPKSEYLHQNPVRSGYVWSANEYNYSSSIVYSTEQEGLLPIERL